MRKRHVGHVEVHSVIHVLGGKRLGIRAFRECNGGKPTVQDTIKECVVHSPVIRFVCRCNCDVAVAFPADLVAANLFVNEDNDRCCVTGDEEGRGGDHGFHG